MLGKQTESRLEIMDGLNAKKTHRGRLRPDRTVLHCCKVSGVGHSRKVVTWYLGIRFQRSVFAPRSTGFMT